jgi:hypothetical protein
MGKWREPQAAGIAPVLQHSLQLPRGSDKVVSLLYEEF